MADLTYGEQQPVDDGGAKFLGVVVNDGGKGTFGAGNSVMLTKGFHDIRVDFGQGTGGDDAQFALQHRI